MTFTTHFHYDRFSLAMLQIVKPEKSKLTAKEYSKQTNKQINTFIGGKVKMSNSFGHQQCIRYKPVKFG